MKLTGQKTLPVAPSRAWAALHDTAMLRAAVPGCESLVSRGDGAYALGMVVAVGPLTARFRGHVQWLDGDAPHVGRLAFSGTGGAAGSGRGQLRVRLQALSPHKTRLTYQLTAELDGLLMQLGKPWLDGVARTLARDFFSTLKARLQVRTAATTRRLPRAEAALRIAASA